MKQEQKNEQQKAFEVPQADFEDYNGICLSCGEIHYGGVEPDARCYHCDACGADMVYGLEEALIMGRANVALENLR